MEVVLNNNHNPLFYLQEGERNHDNKYNLNLEHSFVYNKIMKSIRGILI